jgi:hypothetical protein
MKITLKFLYSNLILILVCLCFLTNGIAQSKRPRKEAEDKIKVLFVTYMTHQLNLNETEAQKFWPIHQQFNIEMRGVRDQEIQALEKEEALLNIKKKYKEKFSKIIGEERTNTFYLKDIEFQHRLVDMIRKRRMNERPQGPPPPPPHGPMPE